MSEGIIIALITAVFGFLGVTITVVYGNKKTTKTVNNTVKAQTDLTIYRIEELEKKQDKHNTLIERMYIVEGKIDKLDEKIKVENHRISDLEEFHKPKK